MGLYKLVKSLELCGFSSVIQPLWAAHANQTNEGAEHNAVEAVKVVWFLGEYESWLA